MIFDQHLDLEPVFEKAFADARASGKKILVEYGGDWCPWSVRMASALSAPAIAALIRQKFILIRCYVGEGGTSSPENVEFPRDLDAVPFFALIDADGRIVATQRTEPFEFLWFYRKSRIRDFLTEWSRR